MLRTIVTILWVALASPIVAAKDKEKENSLNGLPYPMVIDSDWYTAHYYDEKKPGSAFPKDDTYNWFKEPVLTTVVTNQSEISALELGLSELEEQNLIEQEAFSKGLFLKPGTPAYKHQRLFKRSHSFSKKIASQGYCFNQATLQLSQSLGLSKEFVALDLPFQGRMIKSEEFCNKTLMREVPSNCKAFKRYRSFDGSCNNLDRTTLGSTFMPLRRLTPAFYSDGEAHRIILTKSSSLNDHICWIDLDLTKDSVSEFRKAKDGKDLPSPRKVSSKISLKRNVQSPSMSVLHMTYGQFLDHDLDFSPLNTGINGSTIACCPDNPDFDPLMVHPECAPILIPEDDPFYAAFNQTCMEFVRSVPSSVCQFGTRTQINEKTSYLDGSLIYGTEKSQADSLREFKDGLLKSQTTKDGEELLQPNTDLTNDCNKQERADKGEFCFISGDRRLNEQPNLVLLHVVFSRHHNRLAKALQELNPRWNDEKLYQETRRIVAAHLQHITYNEYISAIFGRKLSKQFGFLPLKGNGRTKLYNPEVSPEISTEFSTAAFRFGHSQISSTLERMEKSGDVTCTDLSSQLMNPFVIYSKGAVAELTRAEVAQNTAGVDPFFTPQVTGLLFRGNASFGMDLVAINLQRGRDHGLPPYVRARMACGLPLVKSFKDLKEYMEKDVVNSLKRVYSDVEDIDLFIGGLAERPLAKALVGPTFACILADQFARIKVGDRYWYETNIKETRLKKEQLKEIRKISLASIMCDVIPEMKMIQPEPMKMVSAKNPLKPCSSYPKLNLKPWKK